MKLTLVLFLLVVVLLSSHLNVVYAQATVGQISGEVQDAQGSVVPGATITVTNQATQEARTATTNDDGFYVVTNLQPGDYAVVAEREGFGKQTKTGVVVAADARVTTSFSLQLGDITETVEVTAGAETVNVTTGEVARVIDREQVQNTAINTRNPLEFIALIPGSVVSNPDPIQYVQGGFTGGTGSTNGNRNGTSNLLIDGGSNVGAAANNFTFVSPSIDIIQEVKAQTSNYSAEYGRNSGITVNYVTRGGGNKFHGSVYEFFRHDALDAKGLFSPAKRHLRYNNFGYNFNGPVTIPKLYSGKDKFFFFFAQEWRKIRYDSPPKPLTLPSTAELRGDFSQARVANLLIPNVAGYTAIDPATNRVVQPLTGTTRNQVPERNLANLRFNDQPVLVNGAPLSANSRAIVSAYQRAIGLADIYSGTSATNNTIFQLLEPSTQRQEYARLDYKFNANHLLFGRYIQETRDIYEAFGFADRSDLPIASQIDAPGKSLQLSYTWLITASLVNEAKINASSTGRRYTPVDDTGFRNTYGFVFPQVFPGGGEYTDSIPQVSVTGTGSTANFAGPAGLEVNPSTDISFSDNLSIVSGNHSIKTGLLLTRARVDRNAIVPYTGNVVFNGAANRANSTGNAFADALLGNFNTYSESSDELVGFFRATQFEAFVSDTFKPRRNLSLEFGMRYYYIPPFHAQADNISNFLPSLYDPAQAVTVLPTGTIDTARGGNRFNGLIRAGQGVPQEELGRVTRGTATDVLSVPTGAPRGLYDPSHRVAPRLSFAYAPKGDATSIRGGFGVFFDRVSASPQTQALRNPPYNQSVQYQSSNFDNPSSGLPVNSSLFGNIVVIDTELEPAYTMQYSLGIQHEFRRGFLQGVFAEATYLGNQGRHLLRRPDINRPAFEEFVRTSVNPDGTIINNRPAFNALRPYKGYTQIQQYKSDSVSNYNAMQLYVAKRKGNLKLTGSYTFSKTLTDAEGMNFNNEDLLNRSLDYSIAGYSRPHIFIGTYTYQLPTLPESNGFVRALLGGYLISGVTRLQSGGFETPTFTDEFGTRRPDYISGDINQVTDVDGNQVEPSVTRYFNTTAFAEAPLTRRGTAARTSIRSPNFFLFDTSLRKRFAFTETVILELRADLFNAFNRLNLDNINVNLDSAAFGQVTSTGAPRNIQLGVRLSF